MLKLGITALILSSSFLLFAQGIQDNCINCTGTPIPTEIPLPEVPGVTAPLVEIQKPILTRNAKASYCKRDVGMIDTIVFHHSASPTTQSIKTINNYHKGQGSKSDPWLMIGYNYAITSPYSGASLPLSKVEEGRPLDIVGSQTGTDTFTTPSPEAQAVMNQNPPTCGVLGKEFTLDKKLYAPDGRSRANVSTLGVVIIGNYEPYSKLNPSGYAKATPRYPSEMTLELAGKFSCQMQKDHPTVKFIRWHNYYKSTGCPGTITKRINKIIEYARKYGCEFSS